jgi:hypothetical protein
MCAWRAYYILERQCATGSAVVRQCLFQRCILAIARSGLIRFDVI